MVKEESRDNVITESIQRHKPIANWQNMARQNPCKVRKNTQLMDCTS